MPQSEIPILLPGRYSAIRAALSSAASGSCCTGRRPTMTLRRSTVPVYGEFYRSIK